MLLSVARLRHLTTAILFLLPLVQCREQTLFTSSVTYCAPPESILIEQLDITYFASNATIFFNISAASVEKDINVTANLLLNVYGIRPVNLTLPLCGILNGALCPLPQYNFTGSDSIPLPSSAASIASRLPGIAYKIPDLEAFAQITLTEVGTGVVKACVQSTLSNGWSAHQIGAEWAAGGIALLALFSAIWHSIRPEALAPFRFLDLIYLFQSISISAYLNLNYPSVYRAFALNFSWAVGLFHASATSSMQNSINNMRHLTGGQLADASGGSVSLVNRKLSPYNVGAAGGTSFSLRKRGTLAAMDLVTTSVPRSVGKLFARVTGNVETVTTTSDNILEAGVPIYVNSINIATANAFMTVFFVTLIMIVVLLGALALGYGSLVLVMRYTRWGQRSALVDFKDQYPSFAKAWGLRVVLIAFGPVVLFTFYQWTLKDSWLSVLLSVFLLLFIAACVLYPSFLTLRLARRSSPYALYTETEHINANGPLYAQYRHPRYYYFIPLMVAFVVKAMFIAFSKAAGEVQVIALLVVEVGLVLTTFTLKPFKTKGGYVLGGYLAVTRMVCTGLMVAFIESLRLAAIPRVAIGIIIAVIWCISVIVMFFNIALRVGLQQLGRRKSPATASQDTAHVSILEKADSEKAGSEKAASASEDPWYSRFRRPSDLAKEGRASSSSDQSSERTYAADTAAPHPNDAPDYDDPGMYLQEPVSQSDRRWDMRQLLTPSEPSQYSSGSTFLGSHSSPPIGTTPASTSVPLPRSHQHS